MRKLGVGLGFSNNILNGIIDPVDLDNVISYWNGASTKTIDNGNEVTAVTAELGLSPAEVDAGDHVLYKPDQFNGAGGFEFQANTQIEYGPFTASAEHFIGYNVQLSSNQIDGDVFFFSTQPKLTDNQAKIRLFDDQLYLFLNEAVGNEPVSDVMERGKIYYVFHSFNSASSLVTNVYSEDGSLFSSYTSDPFDDFAGLTAILIGARTSGSEDSAPVGMKIDEWVHLSQAPSSSIEKGLVKFYKAKYDVDNIFQFISSQTDILAASPQSFSLDNTKFNEDEGALIIRYDAPADFSSNTYLNVAHDGGSSNTIGSRIDTSSDQRGFIKESVQGNLHSATIDDEVVANTCNVTIIKYNNAQADILSNGVIETTNFAGLADGLTTINIGSRNGGSDSRDLTVYEATAIKGDVSLDYIHSLSYKPGDLIGALAGQSLADGWQNSQQSDAKDGLTAFKAAIDAGLPDGLLGFVQNGASGGSAISDLTGDAGFWWDPSENARGNVFDNFVTKMQATGFTPRFIVWAQGEADSSDIGTNITKALYKEYTQKVFEEFRTLYGPIPIYIQHIGRRAGEFLPIGGIQAVSEAQRELVDELDYVYSAAESYDVPLTDAVHPTDAGYTTIATRVANKILSDNGYAVTGSVNGMEISNVSFAGTTVTVTLNHDAGTDFTPTTGIEGFVFADDGASIPIDTAVRTNGTTITLTLSEAPAGTRQELFYAFDGTIGEDIANFVKDNSATALPLKPTRFVINEGAGEVPITFSVVSDAIAALDNIITNVDFAESANYTFSSGVTATAVASTAGIDLTVALGTPEYSATAFGGAGGLLTKSVGDTLHQVSNFTPTATQTMFIVVNLPTYVSFKNILSYTNGAGANGDVNARLTQFTPAIRYLRTETGVNYDLTGTTNEGVWIVAFRINSASSMDIFANSTTPTDTIDPNDIITTNNNIRIGSRNGSDGVDGMEISHFLHTSDALTDTEMADVVNQLAAKVGLTL